MANWSEPPAKANRTASFGKRSGSICCCCRCRCRPTALLLLTEHAEQKVIEAVRRCVARRVFSRDAVLHELHNKPRPTKSHRLDLAHRPDLAHWGDGIRSSAIYDRLREEEVVA